MVAYEKRMVFSTSVFCLLFMLDVASDSFILKMKYIPFYVVMRKRRNHENNV